MDNPCEKCKEHPATCGPGIGENQAYSLTHACGPYARYLGYTEGQVERDMLRRGQEILAASLNTAVAERDMLRKAAVKVVENWADWHCPYKGGSAVG